MALVLIRDGARAITWIGARILIVAAVIALAGCASYAERYAQSNEQGLATAGFEVRLADTPEKLAALEALTQRKILVYERPDRLYFVWPDARFCKCLYLGNEAQYQEYARLGFEQKLERERITAAEEREAASLFVEGPGGFW
ncbi:MAG TPA: hypothetical protein VKJ67_25860 [Methylomirabilota bacterium]|nr:hypothetical protein [Methylomirabilota bacterium]